MEISTGKLGNPKPVDWSIRLFWRRYQPITEFTVSPSVLAYQCGRQSFPVIVRPLKGDGELLLISPVTAQNIANFIKTSQGDSECSPGDRLVVWRQDTRFGLVKKRIGMAVCFLSEAEGDLFADVLLQILKGSGDERET